MALMMRFRWNKPCAADSCWLTSTGNAAERGMVPEGIHAKAAESTFPVRFPAPDNAHPNAGVRTVPARGCLSLPGLATGVSPPGPVAALNGPAETWRWVSCRQLLRVTAIGMGRGHVFVEGLAGVVVPGKLVVDHSLAVALGVLAPVWGKLRLYIHLMIGPSGSKGRTGAAAGLLGPPPRTMATFCSNIGRLTATGRVADSPLPASPGGAGFVCGTRLPGLMVLAMGSRPWWKPAGGCVRGESGGGVPGPRRRSGVTGLRGLATTTDLLVRA